MPGSSHAAKRPELGTYFAPPERESMAEIWRERVQLERNPLVRVLLDSEAGFLLVLNAKRQIVAAGSNLPKGTDGAAIEAMIGLRPGEAIRCSHSKDGPGGCGTGPSCAQCGAVQAIEEALERKGKSGSKECRMLVSRTHDFEALEFRVNATYFEMNNERFVLFAMTDISHEKRRQSLERVFFHDVLNLAGGVEGLLELLLPEVSDEQQALMQMVCSNMRDLREEISVQRDLLAAEQNELKPTLARVQVIPLLTQLMQVYRAHTACQGRMLRLSEGIVDFDFRTDMVLLRRVLGNLVKNAAEASSPGQCVLVDCHRETDRAVFTVHNDLVIPESTRLQIFQRSFSTKGEGRGLGTYSVKLLTERYLKGRVSFVSRAPQGTTFTLEVPLNL